MKQANIAAEEYEQYPFALFGEWFGEANSSSAVFLATANADAAPSCRVVLLKGYDEKGFVIYTNMHSRKGREVTENPQAALCFYWPELGKQVRIEGRVTPVSNEEADAYFASRPLKSRIGAWASKQSEPMQDAGELLKRVAYYTAKWATGTVNRPPHWSGIRVVPDYFEFWRETGTGIPERRTFRHNNGEWHSGLLNP